jgi:hypothetical protein
VEAPVAHACNPSYSEGSDQEDHSSKPAQANSSLRPYLEKNLLQKKAGGVAQGEDPEFKLHSVLQKKKEKKKMKEGLSQENKNGLTSESLSMNPPWAPCPHHSLSF